MLILFGPYESGDDELDTEYGIKAYNFKNNHPYQSSVYLKALLKLEH